MIKVILCDFSGVILKVRGERPESMNALHQNLSQQDEYHIFDHFELNEELLNYLENLKNKYTLAIFTTSVIQDEQEIKVKIDLIFEKIYSASTLNLDKSDPKSYQYILDDLKVNSEEVLFIDDSSNNIEAAKDAGLKVILYQTNREFFQSIRNYV